MPAISASIAAVRSTSELTSSNHRGTEWRERPYGIGGAFLWFVLRNVLAANVAKLSDCWQLLIIAIAFIDTAKGE
jgi:hypothetical protein